MKWPPKERWEALWQRAGGDQLAGRWYDYLAQAYAEPDRYYHNSQHIAECLAEFDGAQLLAIDPVAVEFALWFHDAVYDPKANDNEQRSAALAKQCLSDHGISERLADRVVLLVTATRDHESRGDPDAALVIDIDLSILGQDERRFSEYEEQIRREYAWVPEILFAHKRAEILKRFLTRPSIYGTEWFRNKYEQAARRNLESSIRKLERSV